MMFARLFTNKFETPNQIKELDCAGYSPVSIQDFGNKKIRFKVNERAEIHGVFVTNEYGDFKKVIFFDEVIISEGGQSIFVEFG